MPGSEGLDRTAISAQLTDIVAEAGRVALRFFHGPVKSWFKGEGKESPVSEADLAVDRLIRERVAATGHNWGWLSEETEDDQARLACDRIWVVDPIDGTRAFLAGFPDWTISAALVEHGRPIIGVLYAPVTDEMFCAVSGHGATLNGTPIAIDPGAALAGARIAGPQRMLDRFSKQLPDVHCEPKIHSLALRFARVAQGRIDVAFAGRNSHDWDLAGADLLVHEAGGVLTTMVGETVIYNRPRPQHEALVATGRSRLRVVSDFLSAQPVVSS